MGLLRVTTSSPIRTAAAPLDGVDCSPSPPPDGRAPGSHGRNPSGTIWQNTQGDVERFAIMGQPINGRTLGIDTDRLS
jgi:hypothetical protein